jgi:hypothetical protein
LTTRIVSDTTTRLIVTFTNVLHTCKTAAMKFDKSAHWPNRRRIEIVPTLQPRSSQSPTNLDVIAPIKARACDALQAVLRSKSRQVPADPQLMRRGLERC